MNDQSKPHPAAKISKRPAPPAAASTTYRQTAMKEWMVGAIRSLGGKKMNGRAGGSGQNKIICSKEYLSCAFSIAHSLADQLCAIEEQRSYELEGGGRATDLNGNESWSNSIYINCGVKKDGGDEVMGSTRHDSFGSDVVDDFDILAKQLSSMLDSDDEPTDYLNIKSAILVNQITEISSVNYDTKREIYSLGEVFYELFSGGQHVPKSGMPQHQHTSSQSLPTESATAVDREGRRSSRSLSIVVDYGTTDKHELKTAMELIDEIGEDDELFGSAFSRESKIDHDSKNMSDIEDHVDQTYLHRPSRRKSDSFSIGGPNQKSFRSASPESRTVEPLRLLALPTSLCTLISNMIECTNMGRTVRGDDHDTYKSMADVRDDLKMLMDTPDLYLRDIDIIHASNVGLQYECIIDGKRNTPLCGREMELGALKESYRRSISGEGEVAMIRGPSGIGKSKLSQEFADYISTQSASSGGCIFLSGRFDRVHQSQPFQAIGSAFDKYFSWLSSRDQKTVENISSALHKCLKDDVTSLISVMPKLSKIIGSNRGNQGKELGEENSAVDAQKRLRYLFCQFVGVISRCHEEPLILFLDNCQWIDPATNALLHEILAMSGANSKGRRFFFYCCCRDNEKNEQYPFCSMLSSLASFGIKTTKVYLDPLIEDTANDVVSTSLKLLPRLTRPLGSILYKKTKGSPLFIKQLLVELSKKRILYPSLTRRRWLWENDKIRDMETPDNIDILIKKSFNRLPSEVLSALRVLSCFGASADVALVQRLETEINQSLLEELNTAVAAGVLGKMSGKYYFLHDKVYEVAYSGMDEEERCLEHFKYGLALGQVAVKEKNHKLLIIAVEQMNYGGPEAVVDGEQGVVVAKMNLSAGKIAMKMSDYLSAYSFFDSGISYLRKGHWDYHYNMTLELFNLAAKCAFTNGDYGCLKILTGQIIRYAKCFEDKCQAVSISITLLSWSVNVSESMKVLLGTLKSLGEELPAAITSSYVQDYLRKTREKLSGLSDISLLSYPSMVDQSKVLSMELLVKLHENLTFSGETTSLPLVPLKMIQISLDHGMTALSPVGFAQYGNYLALVKNDFEDGYRYVKFASSLMKKMPSRAHDGDVIYYSTHTRLVAEPMQSAVENYLEASKAAMRSGATKYAIASCYLYDSFSFWTGKKLDAVLLSMKETTKRMKFNKNKLTRALLRPTFRVVLRLIGCGNALMSDMSDDKSRQEENITGKITSVTIVACIAKLHESLVFREFSKAKEAIETLSEVESLSGFNMSAPTFHRIL